MAERPGAGRQNRHLLSLSGKFERKGTNFHEAFYQAHPDWFAVDAGGKPYRAGELYVSCINGPYYEEYLPDVLREIIERTHPEGITDNSWNGLDRGSICYCQYCARRFRERTGKSLPTRHDWNDPVYREWIQWSYARRLEIWDLNNRVTKAAGGPLRLRSILSKGASLEDKQIPILSFLHHRRRRHHHGRPSGPNLHIGSPGDGGSEAAGGL